MKFFTRVAFLFVAFAAFPLSFSYAEDAENPAEELTLDEAKILIDSLPTAHDVVSGTVPTKTQGFYDIYGRQIAFREGAKELRASLDERRENFEEPRVKAIDGYRSTVKQVYAAESVDYQSKAEDGSDEDAVAVEKEDAMAVNVEAEDMPASDEEIVSIDDAQDEEEPGLVEKPIPSDDDSEGAPKKKVVMPDDAPEFDPADL